MRDKKALLLRQLALTGVDGWVTEHRFHPIRRWRFDVAFPARMLAVEVEGGLYVGGRHSRGKGAEDDMVKYAEALRLGWRVLRVSPRLIREGRALEWVESLLGLGGAS